MNRKLASVQRILELNPIEGADAIEVATILGWKVVVKKGEFKVNDLCIYFEIDSLLPQLPQFEFLADRGTKTIIAEDGKSYTGYRLRTIRLRKQISQGLALPVASFPAELKIQDIWEEGKDVTEKLGVVKYEQYITPKNQSGTRIPVVFPKWLPVRLGMFIKKKFPKLAIKLWGRYLKAFPSFIPKTDETRLQAVPNVLNRHLDKSFYVTEKLDGSSITVFIKDGELQVCSRTIWLPKDPTNEWWKVIINLGLEEKLKALDGIALQGEVIGEGFQSNKLKLKGNDIRFYSAFNYNTQKYLDFSDLVALLGKLNLPMVPVLDTNFILLGTVDEMVTYATRKSVINPDVWVEGIVLRPLTEATDEELGRLSFKVINPEFLITYGE